MGHKDYAEEHDKKRPNIVQEILGFLLYVAMVVGITFFIITFIGQRTYVSGSSMENTLHHGDNLIVDKITYRFSKPKRFDIIVFPFRHQEKILRESYGKEIMKSAGLAADPITLGEDEYFVLGDNRNDSTDSRDPSVGVIHKDEIIGRAFIRIWPLDKIGVLKHQ